MYNFIITISLILVTFSGSFYAGEYYEKLHFLDDYKPTLAFDISNDKKNALSKVEANKIQKILKGRSIIFNVDMRWEHDGIHFRKADFYSSALENWHFNPQ